MKRIFYLLFLLTSLFSSLAADANVVTIKGYVKLANGSVVVNKEVKIAVYLAASTTACSEQLVVTNSLGFYSKELSCTGDIHRTRITVKNCDGATLVLEKEVPVSKIVEANFTTCQAAAPACAAKFTWDTIPASATVSPFSAKFNSSPSEVGNGDNIISRSWDFHDGTPLLNDRVDPLHTFPRAGTYEVCLVIKTALACESRICKQVTVPPTPAPVAKCAAKFTAEPVPASSTVPAFSVRFNSSSSEVGNGDQIIHRTWDFHDGTQLFNDRVDPLHTFPHTGTYEVCLVIKTALGCESRVCKQIIIPAVANVTCAAKFTFERLSPKKFRFNSSPTTIDANDAIIDRKWDFRDSTTSHELSPVHEFAKPGKYEVCLTIRTAKGCESKFCSVVKVEDGTSTDNAPVQIISLYPSPVHESLKAVILSKHHNLGATIAIVDAFGVIQSSKQVTLVDGYNPIDVPVSRLRAGSYFIRVTTAYGVISKSFYKV